jgi:hypothetical protein
LEPQERTEKEHQCTEDEGLHTEGQRTEEVWSQWADGVGLRIEEAEEQLAGYGQERIEAFAYYNGRSQLTKLWLKSL